MKAKIALFLSTLLIMTAPVFAEVTTSGEFVFGFNESDSEYEEVFDTADLIFTGSSAEGYAEVIIGLDLTFVDTDPTDAEESLSEEVIDKLYATLDVTGAAGIESPVDVSLIVGKTNFEPEGYLGDVRAYTVDDVINVESTKNVYLGLGLNVMDMFNVVLGMDPDLGESNVSYTDGRTDEVDGLRNMFVGINGTFGMVKAEFYYNFTEEDVYGGDVVSDNNVIGDSYTAFGGDFLADLGVMTFGAGFEYNDYTEETRYGVGARTGILDRTDMGVSFAGSTETDFEEENAKTMEMGFDANYALTEAFKVYGGLLLKDLEELDEDDMVGYEISASYTFKEDVTAYVGYVTEGSAMNAQGDVNEDSVFFVLSAAF
jgi:hypothetical protein